MKPHSALTGSIAGTALSILMLLASDARATCPPGGINAECTGSTSCALDVDSNFQIALVGVNFDGTNTTFTYQVCEVPPNQDLSHWVLGLVCGDLAITPPGEFVHPDPTTCLTGIKFDTPGGLEDCQNTCMALDPSDPHLFNIVLAGNVPVAATPAGVTMTTKAGQLVSTACLQGPDCCAVAGHCDDDNACTVDSCDDNVCSHTPITCNDNNGCTDDQCDPGTGNCTYTPNSAPCNDNNACTGPEDSCNGGTCGGPEIVCDDDELCTTDTCNPASGCVFTANSLPCDDHDGCTDGDHCEAKECVGGGPEDCNDNNDCTADSCVSPGGCVNTDIVGCCDDNDDCLDANECTTDERCVNNTCTSTPVVCNDNNACTNDSCDPQEGCQYVNNNDPCDDNDVCTPTDRCTGGSCVGEGEVDCDDHNGCTNDECVPGPAGPSTGCKHTNNAASCTDDNACTVGDVCTGGSCTSGTPFDCADEFFCTTDTCADVQGSPVCQNEASSDPNCCETNSDCNDEDVCTDDACVNHVCTHAPVGTPPAEVCDNGGDEDCDELIDCNDPECAAVKPCTEILKDPSVIRFGRSGKPDLFTSHGNVVPTASFDVASQEIAWVLSNSQGIIYSGSLIPGDLVPRGPRGYYFMDLGARSGTGKRFGIFKAKIWGTGPVYYKIKAYGDLSRATESQMTLQFYIGDQTFILETSWRQTSRGWVARPVPIS